MSDLMKEADQRAWDAACAAAGIHGLTKGEALRIARSYFGQLAERMRSGQMSTEEIIAAEAECEKLLADIAKDLH